MANAPLFALLGVGPGAWAGRGWLPGAVAGFPTLPLVVDQLRDLPWVTTGVMHRPLAMLYIAVGLPAVPLGLLRYLTLMPATAPIGVALTMVVAAGTFLHGYDATRRRLARRASAVDAGAPT